MKFELSTLTEYSDEAMLAELQRVVEVLNGERLTIQRFDAISRVHSSTIRKRFGSWTAALDRAGISAVIALRSRALSRREVIEAIRGYAAEQPGVSVTRDAIAARLGVDANNLTRRFGTWRKLLEEVGFEPVALGRRYTDEDCFENVLTLWTHYGRQPHFSELNQPPSSVGSKAYVRRWGGWRAALAAFVHRVNESDGTVFSAPPPAEEIIAANAAVPARSISLSLRYKVMSRDRFRCVTCGASPASCIGVELHVDHIIPWSRGGTNTEGNLRTLCSACNLGKGARVEDAQL